MHRRLILWDIDGTIMFSGGVGSSALEAAVAEVAGLFEVPKVRMHGLTDRQIIRDILAAAGVDEIDALVPAVEDAAVANLAATQERMLEVGGMHPGAVDLIERLADTPGVRQTLVTGNLLGNARIKLAVFGLDRFIDLEVGAYGSDHVDRNELVPIAMERVRRLRGESYDPEQTWVVGDTDRDLACAQVAGVRCMLVCTGQGRDTIGHLEPDALVDDFTDIDAAFAILTGQR
jgi:phosphoglycolate phosphatase-like HAD superfamily hydrolase